ncbi:hypothetical protein V8F06_009057 [Rhypophila decipiens]
MTSLASKAIEPPLNYSNDIVPMTISSSILLALATIAVALRFLSKRLIRTAWQLDDYLALLGLIFHHGLFISSAVSVIRGGIGRDIRLVMAEDPENIVILFKSFFASEVMYGLSCTTIKLSVLAFYHRIFPTRTVKLGCYILGGMSIAWTVAVEIVVMVQCRPLQAFWYIELKKLPTTKCIDIVLFFLTNSSVNTVIDLAILMLPIREIAMLHTSRNKKIGIASVFLLGGIAFAASLTRTTLKGIIYREGVTNFTKQTSTSGTATVIEVYVAIIGACLPTLVPVYRQLRYGDPLKTGSIRSNTHGYYANQNSNKGASNNRLGKNKPLSSSDTIGGTGVGVGAGQGSFDRLYDNDEFGHDLITVDYLPSDQRKGAGHGQSNTAGIMVDRKVEISTTSDPWYDGGDGTKSGLDLPLQGIMVKKSLSWEHNDDGSKV